MPTRLLHRAESAIADNRARRAALADTAQTSRELTRASLKLSSEVNAELKRTMQLQRAVIESTSLLVSDLACRPWSGGNRRTPEVETMPAATPR
jgi:hypothetical protein